ncbi:hypothetical protein WN51_09138 [Melipona quadrifasciata]|uniref:Uncharacterized protein n=1 Tax=Melipona quadrifasciata TaxID=166423 RepID=A0A0M9A9N5_9HYME|nr:hypothetical protein WN51_09138 [Melipona quadrifasciata]
MDHPVILTSLGVLIEQIFLLVKHTKNKILDQLENTLLIDIDELLKTTDKEKRAGDKTSCRDDMRPVLITLYALSTMWYDLTRNLNSAIAPRGTKPYT